MILNANAVVIDCPQCSPLSGISIGMTCPACNRPFRNVRSLSADEIKDKLDMRTIKQVTVLPIFVEYIPKKMEQGILYISKEYGVANHLCLCGCGEQTVTPLGKDEWQLIENGDKVSLTPSIANYQMPCKSHYIITKNVANFV